MFNHVLNINLQKNILILKKKKKTTQIILKEYDSNMKNIQKTSNFKKKTIYI